MLRDEPERQRRVQCRACLITRAVKEHPSPSILHENYLTVSLTTTLQYFRTKSFLFIKMFAFHKKIRVLENKLVIYLSPC